MSWLRSPPILFGLLTLLSVALFAAIWFIPRGSPLALPVTLGGLVVLVWLLDRYWKRLDEAAKQAQQTAWFWGGSVGIGLALGLMMPPHGRLFSPPDVPQDMLMFTGGLVMLAGGVMGWMVAWAVWWWRRR